MINVIKRHNSLFSHWNFVYRTIRFSSESEFPIPKNSNRKYKLFQDEDSPIILDVNEEKKLQAKENVNSSAALKEEIDLKRGVTAVFDIDNLVETLKKDNAKDIFVIEVPKELHYVDFLVIVSARSRRHLLGVAEYIRGVFKKKRHTTDIIPKIEGENSSEWIAMDLGNIALHIMSQSARETYDLESLWSIGAEYDSKLNCENDILTELIKKHSFLLDDLNPKVSL